MCGRGRCTLRPDDFTRACHLNSRPVRSLNMDRYRPAYNIAPAFNVPVVRRDDEGDGDGVVMHCMKWGLVPSFTKKTEKIDHFRMFNARSESLREKASFRRLLPKNRCLVCFEGFYEWKKDGSRKQPYYVHFKDGRPLVFAALFDSWKNSEGEIVYTFTIITTSSSSSLEWLHDRMPVILGNKESTDYWLNDPSLSNLDKILKPYEETDLAWYAVTPAMGKLSFDGPECIKEIQIKTEENKTISQFFSKKRAPEEPKDEKTPIKEEPHEASVQESVKEEPETTAGSTKDEPTEYNLQHNATEEPETLSTLEETRTTGEGVVDIDQKSVKEEPESQDNYKEFVTKEDDSSNTSDFSTIKTRDCGIPGQAKPFARQDISPAKKRSKGSDDKQPTIFSYFGKS